MSVKTGIRVGVDAHAVAGVLSREWTVFRRYWRSATTVSLADPLLSLLAFGYGFGALVTTVGGYSYLDYVGTGVVATAVLFSSVFPGMFDTFFKRTQHGTFDAMLAAPVDTEDLVTAQVLFLGAKAGVYGMSPLLVAMAFGLDPSWGMLLVLPVAVLTACGFAAFGIWMSAVISRINSLDYVIGLVVLPLFLFAGTFFPLDGFPDWVGTVALFNPLYHCVELVRHAVFGLQPLVDAGHVAVLVVFAALMWLAAVSRLRARLVG